MTPSRGPRCRRARFVRGSAKRARSFLGPRRAPGPARLTRLTRSCARPRPAWFLDHAGVRGLERISLGTMARVALLGGGKMGAALVGGLLDGGYDPDDVGVAEVDPERRRELEARFPKVRVVPSGAWAVADADVVIVAVKPGDVPAALDRCAAGAAARRARALDRGGRDDRNRRGRRARPTGGPGDAQHARARRARCLRDRARRDRDRGAPRAGRTTARAPSASWCASRSSSWTP